MSSSSKFSFQSPLYTLAARATAVDNGDNDNTKQEVEHKKSTALIILNSPITNNGEVLQQLWFASSIRICADGGANRLREYMINQRSSSKFNTKLMIPDRVVGDLDSLQDDVMEYFSSEGTKIMKNPCQDTNDLDKSIQSLIDCDDEVQRILIYGAFGGRFDQEMASFQALYKWGSKFDHKLFVYCEDTFAFLLPGNDMECTIQLQQQPIEIQIEPEGGDRDQNVVRICEGPTCGLIPLGGKCDSVTTHGLQWNLDNQETEFGGLLSTSNQIIDSNSQINVASSHPIVFTAEIRRW